MNDISGNGHEPDDSIAEKELMDIFSSMDDDLINQQIDELLADKGECVNMDSLKEKAFNRLEKGKKKRGIGKIVAVVAAAAVLTVSTVYAKDIQRAFQAFFGKSVVYQTVVDGDAYYLPEKLALGEKYVLNYANMSEGLLELSIESNEEMTDERYEDLELLVVEPGGGKSYTAGGYGGFDSTLLVSFYQMPLLKDFELSLGGEIYPISLTKADSLAVDESLVMGVPDKPKDEAEAQGEDVTSVLEAQADDGMDIVEALPLIANVAASRNDEGSSVGISIAVGFEDRDLKLNSIGAEQEEITFRRMFQNDENGVVSSSNGAMTKPLNAYDAEGNTFELREPANAVGRPVTVFETTAASGTPLTLKVPAILAHYEKEVDRMTLTIPKDGETAVGEEVDFIVQKAIIKTVKRTSETTAEVTFDLNTGADKSVKIRDIAVYSKDVTKGETVINGNAAVLTLTFDENTDEAELEFRWPYFLVEGNWTIELK